MTKIEGYTMSFENFMCTNAEAALKYARSIKATHQRGPILMFDRTTHPSFDRPQFVSCLYHWVTHLTRTYQPYVSKDMSVLLQVIANGGGLDPKVATKIDAYGYSAFKYFVLTQDATFLVRWLSIQPQLRQRELWSPICDCKNTVRLYCWPLDMPRHMEMQPRDWCL